MSIGPTENTRLEQAFAKVVTPFEEFVHGETTSGLILVGCAVLALILANTALAHSYEHVLHTPIAISIGSWRLEHSLHHWINDGLMWLFFFVVGLEIKREVLIGELSELRKAVLPIVAAIGGMLVPALFYAALNLGGAGAAGWGVPMATDIAFAVGILVLLGDRIPKSLIAFLVALAIVDDLGAVAVIALFYTDTLVWEAVFVAIGMVGLLIALNLFGIRSPFPYFIVGTLLWMALLESGIHATVAGILTAWTIPARSKFDPSRFGTLVRGLMDQFERRRAKDDPECTLLVNEQKRRAMVQTLVNGVHMIETPLQRLEHSLHIPVAFLVVPLFALANAGIPISWSDIPQSMAEPITLGIMLGLVLGKPLGIAGLSLLAVRMGIGQLPEGANAKQLVGIGLLAGIGFTMSIFIAELAFAGQAEALLMAKTGVLFASLIAGLAGMGWLLLVSERAPQSVATADGT